MSAAEPKTQIALEPDKEQASPCTFLKDDDEIPLMETNSEAINSSSLTILSIHNDDGIESEDGEYEVVQGKKRRKTSKSEASSSKDGANLQVGCTVLFTPTENHKVESLSKLKLTDYLNNAAPTMVTVVRINKARNIVAVDVKRPAFKAELLKLNKLCTVPVKAFIPNDRSNCFGVLRDIDLDCTEQDVKAQLQSSIGIVQVKRLGKTSPVVRVAFAGKQAPQHVKVGLVRTEVIPYRARPLQCYKCHKFGHIAAACSSESQVCVRCGECHNGMCESKLCCVNCQGDHASNAAECPIKARETEVTRYKLEHNTTFREAKEAIHARKQTSKQSSPKEKHQQNTSIKAVPPATAEEFPPLENRNTTTTLDDAATVTQEGPQKSSFWEKQNIKAITSRTPSGPSASVSTEASSGIEPTFPFKAIITLVFTTLRKILASISSSSTLHQVIRAILSLESLISMVF